MKANQFLKLFVLCLPVFIFGCQPAEDMEKSEFSKMNITKRYITLSEMSQTPIASAKLNQVQERITQAKLSRMVYLNGLNFSIDIDKILYIEKDDYKSFTMPIYREGSDGSKVENIIFSLKQDSKYEVYIAEYTLTDAERQKIKAGQSVELEGKALIKPLERGMSAPCNTIIDHVTIYISPVSGEIVGYEITYVDPCPYTTDTGDENGNGGSGDGASTGDSGPVIPGTIPGWSDTGPWWSDGNNPGGTVGGGSSGDGTSPGSTSPGSNPGNNPNTGEGYNNDLGDGTPVITYPVIPNIEKHLKDLAEITNDDTKPYKSKVTELRESLTLSVEKGFEFKKDNNGAVLPGVEITTTSSGYVNFGPVDWQTIVRMHDHQNDREPIFSADDVSGMSEFYSVKDDQGANDAEDVTSLMISRLGAFALKVDHPFKIINFNDQMKSTVKNFKFGNQYRTPVEAFQRSFIKDVHNASVDMCNGCSDEEFNQLLMENFIDWLNAWDTGLGYYHGTLNADGTYTWQRIN